MESKQHWPTQQSTTAGLMSTFCFVFNDPGSKLSKPLINPACSLNPLWFLVSCVFDLLLLLNFKETTVSEVHFCQFFLAVSAFDNAALNTMCIVSYVKAHSPFAQCIVALTSNKALTWWMQNGRIFLKICRIVENLALHALYGQIFCVSNTILHHICETLDCQHCSFRFYQWERVMQKDRSADHCSSSRPKYFHLN